MRAPLEARIAELEATSESAAAYGLPTTYRAAVEEVHEWREAAEEGAMTPSGLHKRLASDARHHDEHHARQVELELRIAKLERELKSVQEYAAVAHQNGLDTYQAERTALLERIAELEAAAAISGQVIVAQADKITEMEAMSEPIEAINSGDLVLRVSAAHDGSRYTVSVYRGDPKDGRLVVQTGGHHERPATWDGAGMNHTWDGAGVSSIVFKLDGGLLLSLDRFSTSVRMSEPHPLAEADGSHR